MPIVNSNEILRCAKKSGYIVPAFNFWTYQDILALTLGASKAKAPLILQASASCIDYNGLTFTYRMIEAATRNSHIPLVVHLDHATDVEIIQKALALGFSSIMFDGSLLPMDENIKRCRQIKEMTKAHGASLEAELGHVRKGDNDQASLTDPDAAEKFIEKTRVDSLAVAVGTIHGMQKQDAVLQFDLIEHLSEKISVPLVLHGSSGVKHEHMKRLTHTGICKINIATRLRKIFIKTAGRLGEKFKASDHIEFITRCYDPVIRETQLLYELLGSNHTYRP